MRALAELDQFRDRVSEMQLAGCSGRPEGGIFWVPTKGYKRGLKIIVSTAEAGNSGWDHVSVSLPNRCPTWDEMCRVKELFFYPEETAMQLHPPESMYVSNHPYCLHLWAPRADKGTIPMPPALMVGIKELGDLRQYGLRT